MKSSYLSSILATIFLSLIFASQGLCGLVMNEGETYAFEFTSLPYDSEYSEGSLSYASVVASPASSIPSTFEIFYYENSLTENPIRNRQAGLDPNFGSILFGSLIDTILAPWQDLQGIVFIEVTKGSIELESIRTATVIGSSLYEQTFAVPIPNSFALIFTGFLILFFGKTISRNSFKFIQ